MTVLSWLSVGIDVVTFPLSIVDQEMVAAGRPLDDSQRATMSGVLPAVTVTVVAMFLGLAVGKKTESVTFIWCYNVKEGKGRWEEEGRKWRREDHSSACPATR